MNRRGFLGSIMLLGAAPALAKVDWLVPVDESVSPSLAGWIQIIQHNVSNESDHLAEWSLKRGDTILMQSMINRGSIHHWWAPPGQEIIARLDSVRNAAPPGVDWQMFYRDLGTGKRMVFRYGRPVGGIGSMKMLDTGKTQEYGGRAYLVDSTIPVSELAPRAGLGTLKIPRLG